MEVPINRATHVGHTPVVGDVLGNVFNSLDVKRDVLERCW